MPSTFQLLHLPCVQVVQGGRVRLAFYQVLYAFGLAQGVDQVRGQHHIPGYAIPIHSLPRPKLGFGVIKQQAAWLLKQGRQRVPGRVGRQTFAEQIQSQGNLPLMGRVRKGQRRARVQGKGQGWRMLGQSLHFRQRMQVQKAAGRRFRYRDGLRRGRDGQRVQAAEQRLKAQLIKQGPHPRKRPGLAVRKRRGERRFAPDRCQIAA